MVIYADVLFVINFCTLYLCLLPPSRTFCTRKRNIFISSLCGALWAVIVFFKGAKLYWVIIGYILSAVIAFGKKTKAWLMFFSLTLLLQGTLIFIFSVTNNEGLMLFKNGIMYVDIPEKIFIVSFLIALPIVFCVEKIYKVSLNKKICNLKITANGKEANINAMYDSGNLLTEPTTGKPVILVNRRSILSVTKEEDILHPYIIPYHSLGHHGAVVGFRPEKIIVDNKKEIDGALVGICDESFSGCDALIGHI